MDLDYVNMWLKSLIREEINKDQLTSVATTLNKSEGYLRHWVEQTDPTPNQGFGVWLLRSLKYGSIRMEDGPRARQILERFIQLRRQNRIADIMQFPKINDLENEIDRIAGDTSKEQGKKLTGIDPLSLPGVEKWGERSNLGITFYKVTDPASLAKLGEGTKWCTRFSYRGNYELAEYYIKSQKYLIIGFKDGKPFIQFNPDYSQIMDVNDVNFRNTKSMNPRDLELPAPDFLKQPLRKHPSPPSKVKFIRPVEPKRSGGSDDLTPQQKQLKNWMPFTHQNDPMWKDWIKPRNIGGRTMSTSGQDLDYERRLANSIAKTKNHDFFERMIHAFADYAEQELGAGHRSPIVENALLEKDFRDIQQNFGVRYKYVGGRRISTGKRDKRAGINGIWSIARYVRNNIQGNWPEFEKKLQTDPYNSLFYYRSAGVNPVIDLDPLLKDTILFARMVEEGKPTVSKTEFNATIKDFFARARAKWKHANFSGVVTNVIEPYLNMTRQSLQDVIGDELAKTVARSNFVGKGTEYWNKKPDRD